MLHLGSYISVSKQTEVLILALIGITCTIFDASLLDLNSNLYKVWDIRMDPTKFSDRAELYMKYILSGVVLIRTFTVHIYLGCYIVLLYPVIFEERPALILPWLVTSAVKCLFTGFIAFSAGFYTCMAYTFTQPTCWEFLISQAMDHIPSLYVFLLVLSYYRDLKNMMQLSEYINHLDSDVVLSRRRKSRFNSMMRVPDMSEMGEMMNLNDEGPAEDTMLHIQTEARLGTTRSLDTLLAHKKNEESRDEIMNVYDDAFDASQNFTVKERTARLLQLTNTDIETARAQKIRRQSEGGKVNKSLTSIVHSNMSTANPFIAAKSEAFSVPSETEVNLYLPERELSITPIFNMSTEDLQLQEETVNSANGRRPRTPVMDSQLQTNQADINNANVPFAKVTLSDVLVHDATPTKMILQPTRINPGFDNKDLTKKTSSPFLNTSNTSKQKIHRTNSSKLEGNNRKGLKFEVLHKNNKSYRNSYKDDGYTQAYIEGLMKKKKK